MIIKKLSFAGILAFSLAGVVSGETGTANTSAPKVKPWWNMSSAKKEAAPEIDVKDKENLSKAVASEQNRKILNREEKAYFRRLEACDKLMQIALTSNDLAMQEQILNLQEKVQGVYSRKTSNLQLPSQVPGGGIADMESNFDTDAEKLLSPSNPKSIKNQSAQRKDK